jgi:hypothetical protein
MGNKANNQERFLRIRIIFGENELGTKIFYYDGAKTGQLTSYPDTRDSFPKISSGGIVWVQTSDERSLLALKKELTLLTESKGKE